MAWTNRNREYERARNKTPQRRQEQVKRSLRRNAKSRTMATQAREKWGPVEDCWLLDHAGMMTEAQLGKELGR
jgi:hypothetical protein